MIRRSSRQKSIMNILMAAFDAEEEINVRTIHARLGKEIVYGSVRSALRILIKHEYVYYTSVGSNNYYKPTAKGYAWFRNSR